MTTAKEETQFLGKFISVLGFLGIILYFSGWIYRWQYFSFFQLDIITLEFPLESFFTVTFQVFLGSPLIFAKVILAIATVYSLVKICYESFNKAFLENRVVAKILSFFNLHSALAHELIAVILSIITLFFLARHQGHIDAWRDAHNRTSTLPVVTWISSDDQAVGRIPGNLTANPNPMGFRIIGDISRYEDIIGRELNATDASRVWRLLISHGEASYIFKSLPSNASRNQRPPLLVVPGFGQDNIFILSPETLIKP